jgi:hypothetical protein
VYTQLLHVFEPAAAVLASPTAEVMKINLGVFVLHLQKQESAISADDVLLIKCFILCAEQLAAEFHSTSRELPPPLLLLLLCSGSDRRPDDYRNYFSE